MNNGTENNIYLDEKWQRINAPSKEDYVENIAVGLREIHSLIEQLDLSFDIPNLPKLMFYNFEGNISKVKTMLSSLVEMAKKDVISANDVSDLIQ